MTEIEIDLCPDCRLFSNGFCQQEDISEDQKYDSDIMVDECVHFEK